MIGTNAHTIFKTKLIPQNEHRFRRLFNDPYSVGMISYYLHNAHSWHTKVYLYNYFSMLTDAQIDSEYTVICRDRNGKIANTISGDLGPYQSKVLDLATLPGLDEFGVLHVHIKMKSRELFLKDPYGGVFFNEYYVPKTDQSIFAHSLGTPIPSHFNYSRLATSLLVPPNFRPFLLIANGCSYNQLLHPKCAEGKLIFINSELKEYAVKLDRLPPLGCEMIDLYKKWPDLASHIGNSLFAIKIEAQNILSKPYLFQWDGHTGWGEHL